MTLPEFRTDARIARPHGHGCGCTLHSRRLFSAAVLAGGAGLALPALGQPADAGVRAEVGKESRFTKLVPAEDVEKAAGQQYAQMMRKAADQRALGPDKRPQVQRLRAIAQRIIPFTEAWNPRARQWRWEVNLLGSKDLNAFCMPGGKIAFYSGILSRLKLDDDEVAMIMGHEIAHALLEHARERLAKSAGTELGLRLGAALLGLGQLGDMAAQYGSQLLSLRFSRDDEREADALGLVLAARAGYDPRAGVRLWQKMGSVGGQQPPQWLSTHPAGATRISDIQARLGRVLPEFNAAGKPDQRFAAAA